jgi:hypothetical protein
MIQASSVTCHYYGSYVIIISINEMHYFRGNIEESSLLTDRCMRSVNETDLASAVKESAFCKNSFMFITLDYQAFRCVDFLLVKITKGVTHERAQTYIFFDYANL